MEKMMQSNALRDDKSGRKIKRDDFYVVTDVENKFRETVKRIILDVFLPPFTGSYWCQCT